MLRTRVMPCLLLGGKGLVKTCKFKNPIYVGDPINAVRIFNQKEVDELILFDILASRNNQTIQFDLIEQITSECFMPLTYGGGIKNINDFKKLFYIGVEKVSINQLIFKDPECIKKAVSLFGSQSIVATIDLKKSWVTKKYQVYTNSGKVRVKYSLDDVITQISSIGVGEIIINSINRDGTWSGFDLELVNSIVNQVNVPVVALGGAGNLEHIKSVIFHANASAVGLGSMAVFQAKKMGVLIKFPLRSELDTLFKETE